MKETEGKNHREQAAIRRAQRREAMIYAALIDKLVRFRPESRGFAFEDWEIAQEKDGPLVRPYICETFRKTEKPTNGKKKAMAKLKDIEAEG